MKLKFNIWESVIDKNGNYWKIMEYLGDSKYKVEDIDLDNMDNYYRQKETKIFQSSEIRKCHLPKFKFDKEKLEKQMLYGMTMMNKKELFERIEELASLIDFGDIQSEFDLCVQEFKKSTGWFK